MINRKYKQKQAVSFIFEHQMPGLFIARLISRILNIFNQFMLSSKHLLLDISHTLPGGDHHLHNEDRIVLIFA